MSVFKNRYYFYRLKGSNEKSFIYFFSCSCFEIQRKWGNMWDGKRTFARTSHGYFTAFHINQFPDSHQELSDSIRLPASQLSNYPQSKDIQETPRVFKQRINFVSKFPPRLSLLISHIISPEKCHQSTNDYSHGLFFARSRSVNVLNDLRYGL